MIPISHGFSHWIQSNLSPFLHPMKSHQVLRWFEQTSAMLAAGVGNLWNSLRFRSQEDPMKCIPRKISGGYIYIYILCRYSIYLHSYIIYYTVYLSVHIYVCIYIYIHVIWNKIPWAKSFAIQDSRPCARPCRTPCTRCWRWCRNKARCPAQLGPQGHWMVVLSTLHRD